MIDLIVYFFILNPYFADMIPNYFKKKYPPKVGGEGVASSLNKAKAGRVFPCLALGFIYDRINSLSRKYLRKEMRE